MMLIGITIRNCTALKSGGGFVGSNSIILYMKDAIIENNSAPHGGGIYISEN